MELHFWDAEFDLYKDEISSDLAKPFQTTAAKNANMHSCEQTSLPPYNATNAPALIWTGHFTPLANFAYAQDRSSGWWDLEHYTTELAGRLEYKSRRPENIYWSPLGDFPTKAIRRNGQNWLLLIQPALTRSTWLIQLQKNIRRPHGINLGTHQWWTLFTLRP